MKLTIGMATFDDFDGVYFTVQALRLYQDMEDVEIIVIDNYGCDFTRDFIENWTGQRYIAYGGTIGTSAPRDLIFHEAQGESVVCLDCHVFLEPGAIKRLKDFYDANKDTKDFYQGPMYNDDLRTLSTHFDPVWNEHMWGTWAIDERGKDVNGEPFDIPMQGLGLFTCRKDAWLGFNPRFQGFGGEEGYIHEKFRNAGHRCLCLPWLRWMHRFGRPYGVSYNLSVNDRIRNYLIGHDEVGLDLGPIFKHFEQYVGQDKLKELAYEALGDRDFSQYFDGQVSSESN